MSDARSTMSHYGTPPAPRKELALPRLAIAKDFLAEYAKLGKPVRSAVEAAMSKFAEHTYAGVHLEHGMKGLEFQAVAVIGVEQGMVPAGSAVTPSAEDPLAHDQDLQRERCVLFVACTRARDHLYVSYTGQPSPFLPPDAGSCDEHPRPNT